MNKYYIYGAGHLGRKVFEKLNSHNVIGFIDGDSNKQSKSYCKKKVFDLDTVAEEIISNNNIIVVIACTFIEEISSRLAEKNIRSFISYTELDYIEMWREHNIDVDLINRELSRINEVLHRNIISKSEQVRNVIIAGYNCDDMNFGCRATSEALRKVISKRITIKDLFFRYELLDEFDDISLNNGIMEYVAKTFILCGSQIKKIKNRIQNCDAIVINGEGSFIIKKRPRRDMYNFCLLMFICIEMNKPFYLVNAMISGEGSRELEDEKLREVAVFLNEAEKIYLRDKKSERILLEHVNKNKVKYVPDALFYDANLNKHTYKFEVKKQGKTIEMIKTVKLNNDDYILLSGNSYAAMYRNKSLTCFKKLAERLQYVAKEKNMILVLIECCPGDRFLKNIATELNIPLICIENNIETLKHIVQHARCFVTGRYHPAIAAFVGGTPCVLMGSNSHKTESLMEVMGIKGELYNPIPDTFECEKIANDTINVITENKRELLIEKAKENGRFMKLMYGNLFEEIE